METNKVKFSPEVSESKIPAIQYMIKQRTTPLTEWFNEPSLKDRLSGTCIKNHRLKFKVGEQLRHEAICQTLGWGWESMPASYITFNDAMSEGDCHAITETGWHADRWLSLQLFPEEKYEVKYIQISHSDGSKREGVGLICNQTTIQWLPGGHLLFALIAEFDTKTGEWCEAVNPF